MLAKFTGMRVIVHRATVLRLNDFHAVMSQTNRLILRRPNPFELFEGVCEVCVTAGHIDLAVVDLLDRQSIGIWSTVSDWFTAAPRCVPRPRRQ